MTLHIGLYPNIIHVIIYKMFVFVFSSPLTKEWPLDEELAVFRCKGETGLWFHVGKMIPVGASGNQNNKILH